jgi:protein-S-isoprenylcysteine O-methyltransferase Ste14
MMKRLVAKAFGGLVGLLLIMAALLFLSAWTFDFWQAWVFLAVFGVSSLIITLYLMEKDPKLLERRVQAGPTAEKEWSQKVIQSLTSLMFIAMLVVPALDHRLTWTPVPPTVAVVGDVLVAFGFFLIFLVYRENTYASAIIEVAPEQKVISSGMYALVRHPMYFGAMFLLIGMPLSLGSWSGLVAYLLFMPALLWRIFEEERLLAKRLPGYVEYQRKVRYRLLPYVW